MATEKKIKGVIIPRHDIAKNWAKAVNFVPNDGELIIYSKDSAEDLARGYYLDDQNKRLDLVTIGGKTYPVQPSNIVRFKFGNGIDNVNVLPFTTTEVDLSSYATMDFVRTELSKVDNQIIVSETEPEVSEETIWLQPTVTDTGAVDYIVEQGFMTNDENKTSGYYEKWNSGIVKYYNRVKEYQYTDSTTKDSSKLDIPVTICKTVLTHNITASNLTSDSKVDVVTQGVEDAVTYLRLSYTTHFEVGTAVETNHTVIGLWK